MPTHSSLISRRKLHNPGYACSSQQFIDFKKDIILGMDIFTKEEITSRSCGVLAGLFLYENIYTQFMNKNFLIFRSCLNFGTIQS